MSKATARHILLNNEKLARKLKKEIINNEITFEKAAKKGLIEAQNNLGNMYYFGQGVKQDYKKAKEYFGKACDGGNQIACINYKKLNP